MSREVLVQILNEIGSEAGFDLKLDENDCCTFSIDGSDVAFLHYEESLERVLFIASVASLPDDEEEQRQLLAYYLSMNYGGMEADGGYFALDAEAGFIVFQLPLSMKDVTSSDFAGAMARFAQQAGYWKRRFIELLESHAQETDDLVEKQATDEMPKPHDPAQFV